MQSSAPGTLRIKAKPRVDKQQISVRLDMDVLAKIDEVAKQSGYTRSDLINTLLRETAFKVVVQ